MPKKQLRAWAQESAAALVRWGWFEQDRVMNQVILDVYRFDLTIKQSIAYRDMVLDLVSKASSRAATRTSENSPFLHHSATKLIAP
ncbi:MAG: hypothetical protein ACRD72_14655 [Candidatus Angelobacter sp.]